MSGYGSGESIAVPYLSDVDEITQAIGFLASSIGKELSLIRESLDRKIVDYTIVYQRSSLGLIRRMFEMIQDGWQPLGPIIRDDLMYAQVVVKYEDKEKE